MNTFAVEILHNVTPDPQRGGESLAIFCRFGRDVPRCQPGDQLDRVALLLLDAPTAARAADAAFAAGNSPYDTDPGVLEYRAAEVRSLCVGDVVVVHTPDGPAAYACEPIGWTSVNLADFEVVPGARGDGRVICRSDVARFVTAALTDRRDMAWGL